MICAIILSACKVGTELLKPPVLDTQFIFLRFVDTIVKYTFQFIERYTHVEICEQ